jgi:dihydrofolate reductase (trimethoprim resistance protein)
MKLSLIVAKAENNVIGSDSEIPWNVKGEQLIFKALTYNHWLIVGRKTFESMGKLPNRKYAVISNTLEKSNDDDVLVFSSVDQAIKGLSEIFEHVFVAGGGQVYNELIDIVDIIHVSTIHCQIEGNVFFPQIPKSFNRVFEQKFHSNIDYTYQIWSKS